MTIRVIAYRDKSRADLLPVSALQEPIATRSVTYGPFAATKGGPRFCPFLLQNQPYKSLQVTFDPPPTFATAKAGVASNAPELRR